MENDNGEAAGKIVSHDAKKAPEAFLPREPLSFDYMWVSHIPQ